MAQHDMNIANQGFPAFRTDLNNALSAINSMHSGTSRPSGAVAGTMWLDTTSASSPTIKFFDGTDDISFATIDYSANTVNFLDSTVSTELVNDTSPQLGGNLDTNSHNILIDDAHFIGDDDGNEQIIFQKTASAVNEIEITNASTGNGPIIGSSGETNVDLNLNPKGSGVLKSGSSAVKIAGKETIWIPALAMYPNSTNGASAEQVELTAGQPELKCLDFDASTDEFAQFSISFPKSWNDGTVTYQAYFTSAGTNTGNAIFTLAGVAVSDNDAIDSAFGTAVSVTKAHSGTANDLNVSSESSAITIAGTPATGDQVFFQISRDADNGSDTLTGDARLLGIRFFFTTDSANDA